jgi:GT2 family glycosyltransferase
VPAEAAVLGAITTVDVVVPTKNRPQRVGRLVRELLAQRVPIDTLIIVDQSEAADGRALVETALAGAPPDRRPALRYVWDRTIDGAAAARNRGLDLATGDVVVCVDDDMVAEPDTLVRLLEHHRRTPDLGAVTPVITNYRPPGRVQRLLTAIFCRGPFRDDRQPVYWHWRRYGGRLVPVRVLGGGMMALRRQAVADLRFDRRYRGASLGEDIDLSWALRGRGWRLAIATDARVAHDRSPRPAQRYEEATLTSWGFVFAKHQPKTAVNRLALAWFVTGVAIGAAGASLRSGSLAPLRSLAAGLRSMATGYRHSTFLHPD